jgi:serine/threonine protein kinase
VAVKITQRSTLENVGNLASLEQEIRVHQSLDHPNVVRVLDVSYLPEYIAVVMECCECDLMSYLREHPVLSDEALRGLFFSLLKGVQYLHQRGIAHIDIKPENCLLWRGTLKLTDFGACEAPPKVLQCAGGTIFYAAPELMRDEPDPDDNRAADIWSLGILVYAMWTRGLPWKAGSDAEVREQIQRGAIHCPAARKAAMPEDIFEIFANCCQLDAKERPAIEEIIAHPAFSQCRVKKAPTPWLCIPQHGGVARAVVAVVGRHRGTGSVSPGVIDRPIHTHSPALAHGVAPSRTMTDGFRSHAPGRRQTLDE